MSIAMRMPAVFHPPVEVTLGVEHGLPHRRSRWHRLGWTGFEALGFLLLLFIAELLVPAMARINPGALTWVAAIFFIALFVLYSPFHPPCSGPRVHPSPCRDPASPQGLGGPGWVVTPARRAPFQAPRLVLDREVRHRRDRGDRRRVRGCGYPSHLSDIKFCATIDGVGTL